MPETALVVMARYPEPGKTKTRLAQTIGDCEAAALYRAFLIDLANRFVRQSYLLHWAYTPAEVDFRTFLATIVPSLAPYMSCFPQHGPDLGARLLHAFRWTYQHGFKRTVLIGSDSPQISREIICQAEYALNMADVVLGPAEDGGYYLIAMREPHDVFTGIPMSTSEVLEQTIQRATEQGLTIKLLESLFDVDESADLSRLAELLEQDASLAPATAAHLATIRSLHD